MSLEIRAARPGEGALVFGFIRALADYEQLGDAVVATAEDLEAALFGPNPRVQAEIAEWNGEPVGFAVWLYNFSTFLGRHGIYLEDLYVEPAWRGRGIGKALMARLARRCVEEGLGRLEWWVLDWNTPALDVYRRLKAEPMTEWTVQRLTGAALHDLAGVSP